MYWSKNLQGIVDFFLKYQDKCIQTEDMPTDEGAKPKLLQS